MAEIKYSRSRALKEMGREIIELPADINFAGRESLQRQMGTYWHPELCKYRLRVAEDRLKRANEFKASTFEQKNYGNIEDMENAIEARKRELMIVLAGGNPETDTLSEIVEKDEPKKEEAKGETPTKKEVTTDLDKEPPMDGKTLARAVKATKNAKPKVDNDDE